MMQLLIPSPSGHMERGFWVQWPPETQGREGPRALGLYHRVLPVARATGPSDAGNLNAENVLDEYA